MMLTLSVFVVVIAVVVYLAVIVLSEPADDPAGSGVANVVGGIIGAMLEPTPQEMALADYRGKQVPAVLAEQYANKVIEIAGEWWVVRDGWLVPYQVGDDLAGWGDELETEGAEWESYFHR